MKKTLILICLLTFPLYGQKPVAKPDEPFTVSVDVDLIIFNVTVLDKKGHLVQGLGEQNFQIFEDGKPQQIRVFHPEDIPATVGLIIDSSGSMTGKLPDVIRAAGLFARDCNPLDEVFVVDFSDRVAMRLPPDNPFTSNLTQIQTALSSIRPSGRTALYDAMAVGLAQLQRGTHQKKALVLLSDGGDNASHIGMKEVIPMAERSSATIYTIGFYDNNDRDRNPRVLHQLAKLTGGESYNPKNVYEMSDIWRSIAGGIRSQYTIGYVSSNPERDGTFRSVKVNVSDKRGKPLEARTRAGYLAPK